MTLVSYIFQIILTEVQEFCVHNLWLLMVAVWTRTLIMMPKQLCSRNKNQSIIFVESTTCFSCHVFTTGFPFSLPMPLFGVIVTGQSPDQAPTPKSLNVLASSLHIRIFWLYVLNLMKTIPCGNLSIQPTWASLQRKHKSNKAFYHLWHPDWYLVTINWICESLLQNNQ